jgi:hypothetical protein
VGELPDQLFQDSLTLDKRHVAEVEALEIKQIENIVHESMPLPVGLLRRDV